jgi:hypothetical protein
MVNQEFQDKVEQWKQTMNKIGDLADRAIEEDGKAQKELATFSRKDLECARNWYRDNMEEIPSYAYRLIAVNAALRNIEE